jgi:putative transposon-encoded protein
MAEIKEINVKGYEMLEKKVMKQGNSGRIYVPVEWVDKKIIVIRTEE